MGLETATYISQLDAANPTTGDPVSEGDNHLRLIKSVLQAQFTALGAAAVTRTAAELNAVTAKLTSFNGRTTPAVVPTEGDYTLNLLGDVSIAAPAALNALAYNGSNWQNLRGSSLTNCTHFGYDGYAGSVTDSIWFTNTRRNTVPAGVATIKNTGASGIGWQLTAVQACVINLSMFLRCGTSGGGQGVQGAVGVFSGAAAAAIPAAGASRPAFTETDQTFGAESVGTTVGCHIQLTAGDKIVVYGALFGGASISVANISGTVTAL